MESWGLAKQIQGLEIFMGSTDHAITCDTCPRCHDRGDVPVILAVAGIVEWRAAEVGADDYVTLSCKP